MGFGVPWGTPFYSGGGTSTLVPGSYPVAIAGRPFLLDTKEAPGGWQAGDIPVQRGQTDTSADPSEATLSTEDLWRRTRQSWHEGAGQEWADRPESSPFRYHTSTDVDPWTRYELSLLNDTTRTLTSGGSEPNLAVAGGRVYVTDGQVVQYTTDGTTWTAITGNPAQTARSIASDGANVYVAYGTSGVYTVASGGAAMTSYATGTALAVGYAKGRLLVAEGATAATRVYNVTATGVITDGNLLLTLTGLTIPAGQWTAESGPALYFIGTIGDQTRIWRTAVKPDGTALDAPVIAGNLPDGQLARSVLGYLNEIVLVGTDDHVWLFTPDGNGNLTRHGRVEAEGPVYAFEPQDRYVWYGGHADATLGRLDLHTNVAEDNSSDFIPASASDLTAELSGAVRSVATLGERRLFTVSGRGVYLEGTSPVASGTLDLGAIGFGIGDLKNVLYADVRYEPLTSTDSVLVEASGDDGPWETAGLLSVVNSVSGTVGLGQLLAERVSLRLTLTGDPVVTAVTLRASPAPSIGERIRLWLRLFAVMEDLGGNTVTTNPKAQREWLRSLRDTQEAVTVQIGDEDFVGIVERLVQWTPESRALNANNSWDYWNGVQVVDIKRVAP